MAQPQTLFARTISVYRPGSNAAASPNIGLLPYSGMGQSVGPETLEEALILSDIPCRIDARGMGRVKGLGLLPGDAPGPGQWQIVTPPGLLADGVIKDRDILVDDLGYRYQVSQSIPSIGYEMVCIRLEA